MVIVGRVLQLVRERADRAMVRARREIRGDAFGRVGWVEVGEKCMVGSGVCFMLVIVG
jgi:hypothetical protein